MPAGPGGSAPSRSATGAVRRPDRVVEGVIKTNAWAVPSNETWSVGSTGLIVYATKSITIDGTLQVASGARFALFAPYFRIVGKIAPSPSGTVRTAGQPAHDVINSCDFQAGSAASVGASPIALPPGDGLYVSASAGRCNFKIFGFVVTGNGRTGNVSIVRVRDGEPGGDIEFGTVDANNYANLITKQIGETSAHTHQIDSLAVDGKIAAGSGGNGADQLEGVYDHLTDSWGFAPHDGGAGGSVSFDIFQFTTIAYGNFYAEGGKGGNGGGIGTADANGIPTAPNAAGLYIYQAAGGPGGSVDVYPSVKGMPPISVGGGGGNASQVSASTGSGWNTLGGLGGDLHLFLAAPGKGGTNDAGVRASNGVFPSMTFAGGNGGSGAPGAAGGPGGSFHLKRPADVPALPPAVFFFNGFNGGAGGAACGHYGPMGGPGGNFWEEAPKSDFPAVFVYGYSSGAAFSGGTGGSGAIDKPGVGGPAGTGFFNGAVVKAVGTVGGPGGGC
jgi:hypothetical protein